VLPSRRRLFRTCSDRHRGRGWAVFFAARQHRPGDASQLVGSRGDHHADRRPLLQSFEPWAERGSFSLDDEDCGSGAMDKQLPQVAVAALADAEESCLASDRVLSRHKSEPCCELAALAKGCTVANRSDDRGGH
jgi:hypothetical protein